MSDIKPGDLVMVVRPTPCCGRTIGMGRTFVAVEIEQGRSVCMHCTTEIYGYTVGDGNLMWMAYRLIRIDPPALPEGVETTEELTA